MPRRIARQLACDEAVGSEELEAAIIYLSEKIKDAASRDDPVPFLAFRNRMIFETTLALRRQEHSSL
jgi:hypothetical protein